MCFLKSVLYQSVFSKHRVFVFYIRLSERLNVSVLEEERREVSGVQKCCLKDKSSGDAAGWVGV